MQYPSADQTFLFQPSQRLRIRSARIIVENRFGQVREIQQIAF
jgi:hypothetical protein